MSLEQNPEPVVQEHGRNHSSSVHAEFPSASDGQVIEAQVFSDEATTVDITAQIEAADGGRALIMGKNEQGQEEPVAMIKGDKYYFLRPREAGPSSKPLSVALRGADGFKARIGNYMQYLSGGREVSSVIVETGNRDATAGELSAASTSSTQNPFEVAEALAKVADENQKPMHVHTPGTEATASTPEQARNRNPEILLGLGGVAIGLTPAVVHLISHG